MADNAVAYRKHPRNALALDGGVTPSTPFCQQAPKNAELKGVVNGQLDGVNPGLFGGPKFAVVAFGDRTYCLVILHVMDRSLTCTVSLSSRVMPLRPEAQRRLMHVCISLP
jgi:hypothetical protein